jgi:hypothetical protein
LAKLADMLEVEKCWPMVRVSEGGILYEKPSGGEYEEHLYSYNSLKRWVSYERGRHAKRSTGDVSD